MKSPHIVSVNRVKSQFRKTQILHVDFPLPRSSTGDPGGSHAPADFAGGSCARVRIRCPQ